MEHIGNRLLRKRRKRRRDFQRKRRRDFLRRRSSRKVVKDLNCKIAKARSESNKMMTYTLMQPVMMIPKVMMMTHHSKTIPFSVRDESARK